VCTRPWVRGAVGGRSGPSERATSLTSHAPWMPIAFVSNDEIVELLRYNRHNPQTNRQLGNDAGSTDTISGPRYSNSTHQQYIRISRPTGLEWNCIGKVQAPGSHIHTSIQLQHLIQSKSTEWAITDDWTDQHIELSQPEWDKLEICKISYQSTICTNGYFFQPGTRKCHVNELDPRPHKVDTTPKTKDHTWTDTSRQQQQDLNPIEAANTWQHLNPTADPFASLPKDYYHIVTNTYATNITVGNQTSPGMESIFALQPLNWLHDVIITWWLGYWCAQTGGLSNFSITGQGQRNQNQIDGQLKPFSPHHFSGTIYWIEKYEGPMKPNTWTSSHAPECSSQSISNSNIGS
jgi:hypothetical protein